MKKKNEFKTALPDFISNFTLQNGCFTCIILQICISRSIYIKRWSVISLQLQDSRFTPNFEMDLIQIWHWKLIKKMFWQIKNIHVCIFTNLSEVKCFFNWCIKCRLNKPKQSGTKPSVSVFITRPWCISFFVFPYINNFY